MNTSSNIVKAVPTIPNVAPAIAQPPQSLSLLAGGTASLSVVAVGTEPLAYQWRRNGVNVPSATNSSLTLTNVALGSAGNYDVFISNVAGSLYSTQAVLTVLVPPTLTTAPAPVNVLAGQNATFTAAASGTPAPAYQWHKDGSALLSATNATLTVTNAQPADVGLYTVAAYNPGGSVTSAPVQLAVGVLPSITTPPAGQTLTGSGLNLAVAASGALTYQWRLNGTNIVGATNASFTVPAPTPANAGRYTVLVGNAAGLTESAAADVVYYGELKFYSGTVLAGPLGSRWQVDYADVLTAGTTNWQPLATVTLPTSPYLVTDQNSPGRTNRYYRALLLP